MMYRLEFSKKAARDIDGLDPASRRLLGRWIKKHLDNCENRRSFGKALSGDLAGLWRYRIGNYRLIVQIRDKELLILALAYGHRSDVYE